MLTIYILKLEHDCYYVGKTNNYNKKINDHLTNNGALWTKLHKVIGEDKIIHNCSPFDEDRYVKEYMAKYGIDKVRGGCYVTEELSKEQYNLLTKEIWAATDACTRCGRKNHFIKDCYSKTDIYNNIIDKKEYSDDILDDILKKFDSTNCITYSNIISGFMIYGSGQWQVSNRHENMQKISICHQEFIESLNIIEQKILLLYLVKYNKSLEELIIRHLMRHHGIYTMLLNEQNIKLSILHLIIFHNIDIKSVLIILLILYNGFDELDVYREYKVGHDNALVCCDNLYFTSSLKNAKFDKYNLDFNYNYDELLLIHNVLI